MTTNSVVDGSDVLIVSEEIDDEVKIIIPPILTSWTRRLMVLEKSMIKTEYEMACLNTLGGAFAATGRNFGALILSHKREKVAKGSPLGSQSLTMRARLHQAINLGLLGAVHEARAVVKGVIRTARQDGDIEVVIHARNSFNWLCSELERKGLFKRVNKTKDDHNDQLLIQGLDSDSDHGVAMNINENKNENIVCVCEDDSNCNKMIELR